MIDMLLLLLRPGNIIIINRHKHLQIENLHDCICMFSNVGHGHHADRQIPTANRRAVLSAT